MSEAAKTLQDILLTSSTRAQEIERELYRRGFALVPTKRIKRAWAKNDVDITLYHMNKNDGEFLQYLRRRVADDAGLFVARELDSHVKETRKHDKIEYEIAYDVILSAEVSRDPK